MLIHEFGKLADVNLNLMNVKTTKSPPQGLWGGDRIRLKH
jgi:hypothetical protein